NTANLTNPLLALLAPYSKSSAGIYKCPGDTVQCDLGTRVRSYSMSCMMAGSTGSPADDQTYLNQPNFRLFFKPSDLSKPSPSLSWVFTEEHPDSINDGFFWVKMAIPNVVQTLHWQDIPGSNHGAAGVLAFADSHVEVKTWTDLNVKDRKVQKGGYNAFLGMDA